MKLWTILVCSYNCSNTICQTLESIPLDGFENDLDIFVVDDGSTEDIKKVVQPYLDKYPTCIHYFRKENGNQGSCINFGIKNANSKFLSLLDSDDTFNKENCVKVIDYLKQVDEDSDLILTNFNLIFVHKKNQIAKSHTSNTNKKFVYKSIKQLPLFKLITLHNSIYSLKLLKQCNPIIENCGFSDITLYYEVLLRVNKIVYLNRKIFLYNYFIRGSKQAIYLKNSIKNFNDMVRVYDWFFKIPLKDFGPERYKVAKKIIGNHFYWIMAVLTQNYNYTKTERYAKVRELYAKFVEYEKQNNAQNKVIPLLAKMFIKRKDCGINFVAFLYRWFPINFLKATRLNKEDRKEIKQLLAKANKK